MDRAVAVAAAAASMAQRRWFGMDPLDRSRVLHRIAGGIRKRQEDLAALISQENGMPITLAQ